MINSQKVKEFAGQQGMDMAGVAGIGDMPAASPGRLANDILPGARSIVVLGVRILNGSIASPNARVTFAGISTVLGQLDRAALNMGRLVEDEGHRAAVLPTGIPADMTRETKGLVGELSLKHAAVAAGLGVIGKSKLLLTPRWGPRVRLAALVTDAELEPDEASDADYCSSCYACAQSCPSGAIAESGGIDVNKCVRNSLKYGLGSFIRFASGLAGKPAEEVQKQLRDPHFWNLYQAIGLRTFYTCFECIKVCPVGRSA